MKKLLIASTNPGKINEIRGCFTDCDIEIISARDFPNLKPVEETGATFEENAVLKAKAYFKMCGLSALSDDGGIEIDALGGEPGVKSRRWIGREMTDWEMVDYTLERLRGVPLDKRTARLRTVIAFYDGQEVITQTDAIEGVIVGERPTDVIPGYPFRSLFYVPRFKKLFKDLTHDEHNIINHRIHAIGKLKPHIAARLK